MATDPIQALRSRRKLLLHDALAADRNGLIPGREYIFIVDVSGSMHGFPLEISKKLMANLIGNLRPTDRFNVLLFSGGSSVMAEESLPATQDNIARAILLIDRQRGGGGTELLPALKRVLSMKKAENASRTIVIATDGYVTVEEEVFDLIRNNLGNANLFAFGIGTAVNRHIIEGMAHVGMGELVTPGRTGPRPGGGLSQHDPSLYAQVKVDLGLRCLRCRRPSPISRSVPSSSSANGAQGQGAGRQRDHGGNITERSMREGSSRPTRPAYPLSRRIAVLGLQQLRKRRAPRNHELGLRYVFSRRTRPS
jgi:hypothetical protein